MTKMYGRRRLYLMRHGHVDYFAPGTTDFRLVDLTDDGQAQAKAAGRALSSISLDRIYHSGLPRTIQTAKFVAAENEASLAEKVPMSIADGMEELRGGVYVTESRTELAARLAFSFEQATEPGAAFLPGGEEFASAYARIVKGFETLILQKSWKTALLVAHEGVNRLLLGYASNAGLAGIGTFEQDLGCINVLDIDVVPKDGAAKIQRIIIKAVNLTPYDDVKAGLPKTSLEHMFNVDFDGARPDFTSDGLLQK